MSRKIIHIDMDCFYAAIEVRDDPSLAGKPVGVGGSSGRGVLTTANYEARKYGCRSAMPVFKARQLCPEIILTPVRFDVYWAESEKIRSIFARYTELIQPLSLDEAYLDVSHRAESGAALAKEIRRAIFEKTGLTASAGIAPNKMLAKVASDWNKPDGQLEVRPQDVDGFMKGLRVEKLQGVGKKGRETLAKLGVESCGDLQRFSKVEMAEKLGRWGLE
ncbi:MAG: DNA polymerase IV, partial [Akkermansiaceae bacterium]